jgi:pyruvate/2-oxoglutarate dehydrogenase complex dihydrolipoamide dehydrogenase (E3) component
VIPWVTFTDPEEAAVGMGEAEPPSAAVASRTFLSIGSTGPPPPAETMG